MLVDDCYIKWVSDDVQVDKLDLNNLTRPQKEWIERSREIAEYIQSLYRKIDSSYLKGFQDATKAYEERGLNEYE